MLDSIQYLLFDLDETLYPASCGLLQEVGRRMTRFVCEFLKIEPDQAVDVRNELSRVYGTTLGGLIDRYGFSDTEGYLLAVHPLDIGTFLNKDVQLPRLLKSIRLPKSILTNSPLEHAERVLDYLEIEDQFEHVFDLRFNQFQGKPEISAFERTLEALAITANQVLFVDDRLDSLLSFRKLGGQVLLIDEEGDLEDSRNGVPSIPLIRNLPGFLNACGCSSC